MQATAHLKLARFQLGGKPCWGVVEGDAIAPLSTLDPNRTPNELSLGEKGLGKLRSMAGISRVPLAGADFLAPVVPPKIVAVGLNYRDHAVEAKIALPASPILFAKLISSVIGPGATIELPPESQQVDWEVELGVVIGRRARRVTESEALDHVAGYVVVNDVSARDIQAKDGQWVRAKSFDTFTPVGPWLVTTDELNDGSDRVIRSWVNGDLKQDANTSDLIFGVPELVSFCSQAFTLEPGDLISTGTPAGVGAGRTPPEFLKTGDLVMIEVDGIGRMENPVR